MTYREAAEHLEVNERHVYRLMQRYRAEGNAGLIHRLRGKPSNRGQSHATRQHVIGLYRQQYADYGPTLFAEQLLAAHSIALDHETVRRWLRSDSITHFERRRRTHRRKRERRRRWANCVVSRQHDVWVSRMAGESHICLVCKCCRM